MLRFLFIIFAKIFAYLKWQNFDFKTLILPKKKFANDCRDNYEKASQTN